MDGAGRLYVASNVGIEVFGPRGDALGVIALPKKPQNLAFSGPGKHTLYVVGRGADLYPDAAVALIWDVRALDAAEALTDQWAQEHDASLQVAGFYPSLHLNYNLADDFVLRVAYAKTLGRPDYADIIPNIDIDEDVDPTLPGTITVANTGLKPWTARPAASTTPGRCGRARCWRT